MTMTTPTTIKIVSSLNTIALVNRFPMVGTGHGRRISSSVPISIKRCFSDWNRYGGAKSATTLAAVHQQTTIPSWGRLSNNLCYMHSNRRIPRSLSTQSSPADSSSSPSLTDNDAEEETTTTARESTPTSTDSTTKDLLSSLKSLSPPGILYTAPMGDLVTRLKVISITSCFLSVVVLPTLVFLKNGDLPSAKQTTIGGVALTGAVGSTAALHFVFGPYVTQLSSIVGSSPPTAAATTEKEFDSKTPPEGGGEEEVMDDSLGQDPAELLFEATTRSVFGWSNTYVFDPLTDVTAYKGARPFANFAIRQGTVPLFIHPEKLDNSTRQILFGSILDNPPNDDDTMQQQRDNNTTDREGLRANNNQQNRNEGIKDDDFF